MKSVFTISASLAISLMLCCTAQANDHKILGVIAMPRNETNDLARNFLFAELLNAYNSLPTMAIYS